MTWNCFNLAHIVSRELSVMMLMNFGVDVTRYLLCRLRSCSLTTETYQKLFRAVSSIVSRCDKRERSRADGTPEFILIVVLCKNGVYFNVMAEIKYDFLLLLM